jgi:cobalt/nickel transport system ATP-binding protein
MGEQAAPFPTVLVEQVHYQYPDGPVALEDISFTLRPGESAAVVGPNGAGKTTLFLSLSGIITPQKGRIEIAGLDLSKPADRKLWPSRAGIIFQNSDDQIFNTTVLDDVAFGPLNLGLPPEEVRVRVAESLRQVGLEGYEQRTPFHLSGGEKRRVAIAGVLAMRPQVLLLDEPSMFLDPRGRRELIKLLRSLPVTKIIASHELEMIRETCDRAIVLDAGRIVADGATRAILSDAALMEAHGLEVPHSLSHHGKREQHHGEADGNR